MLSKWQIGFNSAFKGLKYDELINISILAIKCRCYIKNSAQKQLEPHPTILKICPEAFAMRFSTKFS
jgi:hypothetical protein